jgi:hypothetical protein
MLLLACSLTPEFLTKMGEDSLKEIILRINPIKMTLLSL